MLDWSKFKAFADSNFNVAQMLHVLLICFQRKPEVLLKPWCHCCWKKTFTFCNVSVITEDIYLKLFVHHLKNNEYYQGR